MGKFYAVKVGKVPGIYTSWAECEDQVKGFSGAKYKSFSTELEAKKFMNLEANISRHITTNSLKVFVDGSFSRNLERSGFGCVFILNDEILEKVSQPIPIDSKENLWNVSAEIAGVVFAVNWAVNKRFETLDIYYDYEGLEKWYTGEWNANKITTKKYVQTLKTLSNKIKLNFIKVKAHSGDEFNELADQLAKNALNVKLHYENHSEGTTDNSLITFTANEYYEIVGEVEKDNVKINIKQLYINDTALIKIAKYLWKKEKRKISDLDYKISLDAEKLIVYFELNDKRSEYKINKNILLKGD